MEKANDRLRIPHGEWGYLQDSGILLESGDILSEGRIVEVAREAQKLWEAKDYKGFARLLANDGLSAEDSQKLSHTILTENGVSVIWLLDDALDIIGHDYNSDED